MDEILGALKKNSEILILTRENRRCLKQSFLLPSSKRTLNPTKSAVKSSKNMIFNPTSKKTALEAQSQQDNKLYFWFF